MTDRFRLLGLGCAGMIALGWTVFAWGQAGAPAKRAAARTAPRPAPRAVKKARPAPQAVKKVSALPWWRTAVFYEVFVRSFQDSNGDGVGDIPGLIRRLDYLNDGDPRTQTDLGVTGLWLMPLFRSGSYHGYDVEDYRHIDPRYGTNQDFQRLLKEAHKRGIRVMVDLVVNHTSRRHPWFVSAAKSTRSHHRSWYVWRKDNPGWTQPWGNGPVWHAAGDAFFYGVFWSGMPDLNYRNPDVQKEMTDIATHWLRQGVDGFRLDAARYLVADGSGALQSDRPATHRYWKRFRRAVKRTSARAALVGEVWTTLPNMAPYCHGDELDQVFHFPLAYAIKGAATSMDVTALWRVLGKRSLPLACWATFLSNHDQERIGSQLHGRAGMMKMAAALLLTLPGAPFVYYGEEVGMPNGKSRDDRDKRTPMAWDASPHGGFTTGTPWKALTSHARANVASQINHTSSLLSWYRRLIHLRQAHPTLAVGSLRRVPLKGKGAAGVMAMEREHGGARVLVLLNLEDQSTAQVTLTLSQPQASWTTLLREGKVHVTHLGQAKAKQSPHTLATRHHRVRLGPNAVWIVRLSGATSPQP